MMIYNRTAEDLLSVLYVGEESKSSWQQRRVSFSLSSTPVGARLSAASLLLGRFFPLYGVDRIERKTLAGRLLLKRVSLESDQVGARCVLAAALLFTAALNSFACFVFSVETLAGCVLCLSFSCL